MWRSKSTANNAHCALSASMHRSLIQVTAFAAVQPFALQKRVFVTWSMSRVVRRARETQALADADCEQAWVVMRADMSCLHCCVVHRPCTTTPHAARLTS